jgi:hypothetical protein
VTGLRTRVPASVAAAIVLSLSASHARAPQPSPPRVEVIDTPDAGIQPQAAVDAAGTIHLIYFKGQSGGGDLFYVRRKAGDSRFTAPMPVNSEPGTAIATGSVRGGQIALGRNGWIHVVWNGSKSIDRDGLKLTPMWYARLPPGGRTFEPQRAIGRQTRHLDGGGSIAADRAGQVHVVWHAAGAEDGEPQRRIYVATSGDDGRRFAAEKAFTVEGGACGCCGVEALADGSGRLQLLYRSAGDMIHRDAMWMTIGPQGASTPVRLQVWELPACPMTTFAMASGPDGIVAAWETQQQIYSAVLSPDLMQVLPVNAMEGAGLRKHPSVAINAQGDRLIAWTEGTAWARGGSLAWQLRDRAGRRLASGTNAGPVPVWGLVSAVARPDGSFLVIH